MGKRQASSKGATKLKKQRVEEDKILSSGFTGVDLENVSSSDWENEEQDYENVPRSLVGAKTVEGLPVKTKEGKIQRVVIEKEEGDDIEEAEKIESEEEEAVEEEEAKEEENTEEVYEYAEDMTEGQKIAQLQEDIAEMVEKLIESPEEHIAMLTRLRKMSMSKNINTSRYSMIALVTVFKSIVPGYRIRPLTAIEKKEKVSREVARLREFEESLLANYKAYINNVSQNCKKIKSDRAMARVSVSAACELAASLHHFNFAEELVSVLVRFVCNFRGSTETADPLDNQVFEKCITTLEKLLDEDSIYGKVSFEVCRQISKTLKTRKYKVNKQVVALYLHLEILSDYDPQSAKTDDAPKIKKKDRVHLTKKERKARKERKVIDEELRQAELQVSKEERDRNQAEILRILLSNYLQILKTKNDHLMATVLEGLAKYGFMANLELIGDFLQILRELIDEISQGAGEGHLSDHRIKQVLFCIVTSFTLMSHGNNKITTDMSRFVDVLYGILPDISVDNEINKSIKLLIRTLETIFLKAKTTTKVRDLAFTKRIFVLLLGTAEKPSLVLMDFVMKFVDKSPEIKTLFMVEDRVQNGTFVLDADHPSRSNPEAATIWETALLTSHYCPAVSGATKKLLKKMKGR